MSKETPLFFQSGAHSLFGVLHQPVDVRSLFVFCQPFGEEKLWAHRVFVSFARELAARGHAVLRFDWMGNGDSEGTFSDSSLETACADLRAAIAYARQTTGVARVSLVGLRLGAMVASMVADGDRGIDRLVLWAPVTNGHAYMQELLRINLTTQMATFKEIRQDREALVGVMQQGGTVNVDGYELGFPFYSQVAAVKLTDGRKAHEGPCVIVQVDRQPRPAPDLQQLAASFPTADVLFAQEEPFWKEIARSYQQPASNLFAGTLRWLDTR